MLVSMLATAAWATTVTVCNSGCDYSTVQQAVDDIAATVVDVRGVIQEQITVDQDLQIVSTGVNWLCPTAPDSGPLVAIQPGRTVTLSGLFLTSCDGHRTIEVGADATLIVDSSTVRGPNTAVFGDGGVIHADGGSTVSIRSSEVFWGAASGSGGLVYMAPGGGALEIIESELTGGDAEFGGCVAMHGTNLVIVASELSGCDALQDGGAVYANASPLVGNYQGNLMTANDAGGAGGAIYHRGGAPSSGLNGLQLRNNRICGGRALTGAGLHASRAWDGVDVRENIFNALFDPAGERGNAAAVHLEYTAGTALDHPLIVHNHFLDLRVNPIQTLQGTVVQLGANVHFAEVANNAIIASGSYSSEPQKHWLGSSISNWDGANTLVHHNAYHEVFDDVHPTLVETDRVDGDPMLASDEYHLCDANFRPMPASPLVGAADATLGGPNIGAYPDEVEGDSDGDGHAAIASGGDDCDDTDPTIHPSATERCNGVDDDCDGDVDGNAIDAAVWFADVDSDGYGDPDVNVYSCSAPAAHVSDDTDCDDSLASINPVAAEVCNGLDDDCDTLVDVDAVDDTEWFADSDNDGFGDAATSVFACTAPNAHVADDTDCDDSEADSFPGNTEVCDDVDNDCDGDVDGSAVDAPTWYIDGDGDGFGDVGKVAVACQPPAAGVSDDTDCDDDDADVFPGATEVCDGVDNDCSGDVDSDAVDRTTWYADSDADGYGVSGTEVDACAAPTGHVDQAGDCDDADGTVNPDADERCNGADDDCDTEVDEDVAFETRWTDSDGDGFGDPATEASTCDPSPDQVDQAGDCDDADGTVNPDADERCNERDDDCNGLVDDDPVDAPQWYVDADADGYGAAASTEVSCEPPDGRAAVPGDCDDDDPSVHPDAETMFVEGVDSNCDGVPVRSTLTGSGCACSGTSEPGAAWALWAAAALLLRRQRPGTITPPDRSFPSTQT